MKHCILCGKVFKSTDLQSHKRNHTKLSIFKSNVGPDGLVTATHLFTYSLHMGWNITPHNPQSWFLIWGYFETPQYTYMEGNYRTLYGSRLPQNIFCPRAQFFKRKLSVKMCIFFPNKTPLIRGFCVCYGQSMSVLEILCLSWTVCVCHIVFSSTINTLSENFMQNRDEKRWFWEKLSMRFEFVLWLCAPLTLLQGVKKTLLKGNWA